jgi:sphingolipid delta-4 desaturase
MPGEQGSFRFSQEPEPHKARTKAILKAHPEVRKLIGRNPWSAALIVGIVGLQFGLAYALSGASWWLVVALAWLVGAFANHALFVLIHDAAHNLIFRKRWQNYLMGILADTANVVPAAISFRTYHLKHHSFQGVYDLDADLPNRWEARLIGSGPLGKAFWLLFFPVFQLTRPPRLREITLINRWSSLNILIVVAVDVAIFMLLGPKAFLYLVFSLFFSVGLHPLGARWIQEHYLVSEDQETYSYYGPLNLIALNVGYHNDRPERGLPQRTPRLPVHSVEQAA